MIQNQVIIAVSSGYFYVDLFYTRLDIILYYFGGVFTLSFVQYIVLQIVRQNSKRKKLHVVGILRCMKYGSVANVWFLLWGYIAKNTNS